MKILENMRKFQVEQLARKMHKASGDIMYENIVKLNPNADVKIPGPKTWYEATEATRQHYLKVAEKMVPENVPDKFKDHGPWTYGVDATSNSSKHFVQSEASGEGFDDVRLYINGNMTQQDYVKYGYALAEFLNIAVQVGDNCENCHGEKGGVPGNENIVDGKVLCDHCS